MAPTIYQVAPKVWKQERESVPLSRVFCFVGGGTNIFPELTPFLAKLIFVIDLDSLFCNLIRFVDGVIVVWTYCQDQPKDRQA